MLRSAFYAILIVSLSGCCLFQPKKEVYVEIPVPTSCISWEPSRSVSSFSSVGADAPLWEQVKALLIDRANDANYIEGLNSVMEGCK